MTLIPTVYGDGALLVDITINDSSLNGPPVPYSFGAAGSQISLQLTDKRSEVIRSRRLLRPGEALVLGGTEVVQYDESRKGMDDGLSIGLTGGRESGNREVTRIYYIITAAVRNAG